jgi:DNA repair protein RadC
MTQQHKEHMMQVRSNDAAQYKVNTVEDEQQIIDQAFAIIQRRARKDRKYFTAPDQVKQFLTLANARVEDQSRERFGVLFLDSQHGLIEFETLFEGSLAQTSVYPREVVRRALQLNAAAVILTHNHPSGFASASRADVTLTKTLRDALNLIDVRVLDHIITTPTELTYSLAEHGEI